MKVLLYNLENNVALKTTLNMMNVQCIYVEHKDYNKPLSALLGLSNDSSTSTNDFADEMIIMYEFSDEQLDTLLSLLKMNGIKISLKAIVTDTNINWNSIEVRNELIKERAYTHKNQATSSMLN